MHLEEWRGRGDRALVLDPAAFEAAAAERRALLIEERNANLVKIAEKRKARGIDKDKFKEMKNAKKEQRRVQPKITFKQ